MRSSLAVLGVMVLGITSCGGPTSPKAPAIDRVTLTPGAYEFFTGSLNAPPECGLSGSPAIAAVSAAVTLSHEGSEWIARSTTSADGDLEIRLSDTGGRVLLLPTILPSGLAGPLTTEGVPVAGTLRGTAVRSRPATADGVSFTMNPPTVVTGHAIGAGFGTTYVAGLNALSGPMTFTNAQGSRSCTVTGLWSLTK